MAKRFSKARAWAGRRYANRAAYYTKARSFGSAAYKRSGLQLNAPFLAGAAAAFVLPENEMLTVGGLLGATAPVRGLGPIKGAAQGYVFGQVCQKWLLPKLGVNIGNVMGAGQTYGNVV